jgi:cysteine desulfurase
MMIYLDSAATTPIPQPVADAMYDVLTHQFGNPSSQYALGREAKKMVDGWRKTISAAVGCDPKQLHFTSCGTEGDNWAISAALWQNRRVGRHIVTTSVEHSAVLEPCKWLEKQGYEVTYIAPDGNGDITAAQVLDAVRPDTALVSVMMVNNETGCIFPVHEIALGLKRKNPQTLLHTDAVQGFLKVPFKAKTLGADFITFSAHKIGGPKGIGALYAGERVKNIKPLLAGGGQEDGTRSGTEATAQIAGFAKAVELRQAHLSEGIAHMAELKRYALEKFSEIPDLVPVGDGTAPHVLAVALKGFPSQNIVNDLSDAGICISAGSACHRGKPSHVVAALHLPKEIEGSVIRVSFSPDTSKEDIDACAAALCRHRDTRCPRL